MIYGPGHFNALVRVAVHICGGWWSDGENSDGSDTSGLFSCVFTWSHLVKSEMNSLDLLKSR